jgi:regulator of replication initiation timing
MTIKEIVRSLEEERDFLKKENEDLKLEVRRLNVEKRHIQFELDSLKKRMSKKNEHIETTDTEEQKPKRIRKKKNVESIE